MITGSVIIQVLTQQSNHLKHPLLRIHYNFHTLFLLKKRSFA